MDIFIPFIHEIKKEEDNFEQLHLYIEKPIIVNYTSLEDNDDNSNKENETVIILEII